MTKAQFIRQINFETQKLLKRIYKQSSRHQVRQRSQCLLLKSQGVKLKQLKMIFQVSEKTLPKTKVEQLFVAWVKSSC